MLSIMLLSFGTAHAVLGVNDGPASSAVVPFYCEKDNPAGMNTLLAMADAYSWGPSWYYFEAFSYDSKFVADHWGEYTAGDVVSWSCADVLQYANATDLANMKVTISGRDYYAGYLTIYAGTPLTWWVYLVDAQRGYASGFSPLMVQGGMDAVSWSEWGWVYDGGWTTDYVGIAAEFYFPRYFIVNPTLTESQNWWFFLFPWNDANRAIVGVICDEDELCISKNILLPHELTTINVAAVLSPIHKPAGKNWAGFGSFDLCETYDTTTNTCTSWAYMDYSTAGWSYQRAQGSSVAASWDVIHEIDRSAQEFWGDWTCGFYSGTCYEIVPFN